MIERAVGMALLDVVGLVYGFGQVLASTIY
jgi:hypothetical protein